MRLLKTSIFAVATGSLAALLQAGEIAPTSRPVDLRALGAPISEADKKLPQDNNYVVHEWGTFTSFSGSDGIALDFRPLVDEDLPKFVVDRPRQAAMNEHRNAAYKTGIGAKGTIVSKQRMETPVTYFYTDQERIVDVSVEFPKGLLTEFFPPVRQFGPDYKKGAPEPLTDSWLRWGKVRLIPEYKALNEKGIDPYLYTIGKDENPHYAYARETDSAHIQIIDPTMMMTNREKFLFYRGVGNFDLPVGVKATGSDHFTLTNSGKSPLHYAFVVQIDCKTLRFAKYENIAQSAEMALPAENASIDDLSEAVVKSLISDGLFDKEARAMVKTWKSSWFGEQGTRVFYSLPQSDTDRLLPLHLTPAPKEMTRVMIGRLETLTPEQEKRIEVLVAKLGADEPAVRDQTTTELNSMGRFAEPALTRIANTTGDPETQIRAQALLRQILTAKGVPISTKQ